MASGTQRESTQEKNPPPRLLVPVTQPMSHNTSASADTQHANDSTTIQMYKVNIYVCHSKKKKKEKREQ